MASKRNSTDSSAAATNANNAVKRPKLNLDSDFRFAPGSQDELDIGILRIQNKRLSERVVQRQRIEGELRSRIETLEKKQLTDDTKFYAINRYWNQLNDNVRLILERFDSSEVSINTSQDESNAHTNCEDSNESSGAPNVGEETESFIKQLQNFDKEELDQSLHQRVQLSTAAVSKLIGEFDKIMQRSEKVMNLMRGNLNDENGTMDEDEAPKSPQDDDMTGGDRKKVVVVLDDAIRELNDSLTQENRNLHNLVTSLQQKHHVMSLRSAQYQDKFEEKDNQIDDLKSRIDEVEFELNRSKTRSQRYEDQLYEALEKMQKMKNNDDSVSAEGGSQPSEGSSNYSSAKIDDLKHDLEEQKELAQCRLAELEQLNTSHRDTLKIVEKYKMDLQCIPDSVIRESPEYKSLQSNFSVLYNQSTQIKAQSDEARNALILVKNEHLKQIEQMEADELAIQKELKDRLLLIDENYTQLQIEFERLRLEFEQTLAANEQSAPLNREIRTLVNSSQTYIQQLKDEIARSKKKLKDAHIEIAKLKGVIEGHGLRTVTGGLLIPSKKIEGKPEAKGLGEASTSAVVAAPAPVDKPAVARPESDDCDEEAAPLVVVEPSPNDESKKQPASPSASAESKTETPAPTASTSTTPAIQPETNQPEATPQKKAEGGESSSREIREMKLQLKKEQDAKRELKHLLDAFKSIDKEKREKAQIMANEKKVRMELEELKQHNKKLGGDKRRVPLTPDEFSKKVARFEEIIGQLEGRLATAKQEEEVLFKDMEVTGTAFEDMREQNTRLIQQLSQKDDANFKIISERIKLAQINKIIQEEKESHSRQFVKTADQLQSQVLVIQKLEEKERLYLTTIASLEKELQLRQQVVETSKRRALEYGQNAADLKLHLEKYIVQIRDAQSIVADKTSAWQQETFKNKRLIEDLNSFKRKYERAKKFELATTADEVLHEEIKELKEQLTCPSCKTKRKDAVLNKCFHVFCYDCLKTRYETRQRKCPKCNQSFSANDFHRLYLA